MRLYNGCPDSNLQAILDNRERLLAKLKKVNPKATCVFFPMEGMWQVWVDLKPVCPDMSVSPERAVEAAIRRLEGK